MFGNPHPFGIMFCVELKVEFLGTFWRKANTAFYNKNIKPTVKHGGGSVIVWDALLHQGLGNLP